MYINTVTNESISLTESEKLNYAQTTRNMFVTQEDSVLSLENLALNNTVNISSVPSLDTQNPISPEDTATYVDNVAYFDNHPRYGINNGESCTTVAVQLMLSYNNYYNDRRIIPDTFLNGTSSVDSHKNPNYYEDVGKMDREILGSNQDYHDFLFESGVEGFLDYAGLRLLTVLNLRNEELEDNIVFSLNFNNHTSSILDSAVVIDEINANKPIVIATHENLNGLYNYDEEGNGFNHSVLAYGYETLAPYENGISYLGYIVDFGWADDNNLNYMTKVWTNSVWYSCYLTLDITHTHNHNINTENNVGSYKREVRCSECGHRDAVELFTYSADKTQITGLTRNFGGTISLPSTIDGVNITSISQNAFANMTNMEEFIMYSSNFIIGAGAFNGCTNLEVVRIDSSSNIGANAFVNCSNLKYMYFYKNATPTFGTNCFGNNVFNIYAPNAKVNAYTSAPSAYNNTITVYPINSTITLDSNGGDLVGKTTFKVENNANFEIPATITKLGYDLLGWVDENGTLYATEDGISTRSWDKNADGTLRAVWEPIAEEFDINYHNLVFQGVSAQVIHKDNTANYAPTKYVYGTGVSLTNYVAFWSASNPYLPHLVFIGWYSDANLTTPANLTISPTQTGTVNLYARWRYDYTTVDRTTAYTILDDGIFNNPCDVFYIDLPNYNNLKNLGVKYLHITFKISLYEEFDAYQHLYIYDGSSTSANILWETKFALPGERNTTPTLYTFDIDIDIDDLDDVSSLCVRYHASGKDRDNWVTDRMFLEVMYVNSTADVDAVPFTWHDEDPFV